MMDKGMVEILRVTCAVERDSIQMVMVLGALAVLFGVGVVARALSGTKLNNSSS